MIHLSIIRYQAYVFFDVIIYLLYLCVIISTVLSSFSVYYAVTTVTNTIYTGLQMINRSIVVLSDKHSCAISLV